jgi:hypothetical protein
MDENARKRKRELDGEVDGNDSSDFDMDIEKEKPLEGLKPAKAKKQKTAKDPGAEATDDKQLKASEDKATETPQKKTRADKRKQKAEKKKEKLAKQKQESSAAKAQQEEFSMDLGSAEEVADEDEDEAVQDVDEDEDEDEDADDDDIDAIDVSGLVEEGQSTTTPSATISDASTASVISAASSSSSMPPPSAEDAPSKKENKPFKYDPEKHEAFQSRLTAKLEAMRAARKADGPNGRPARNRAELIESRRKKEADRKAVKKVNRQLAKDDEERQKAEEQLARIRGGSGSPSVFSQRTSPEQERNFAFGRVAWKDGQQLDSTLTGFLADGKKKGRSDPKTALEAAEKKKARISGLDETKRKDIEEKDLWLTAKKRAQGEKVHDDPNLLKRTLKRQEKQKEKSKQEWKDRLTSVSTGKYMKQKKRDENLKKRRDEKGSKGKKTKKPGKKVKKRPGFEGTMKGK